MSYLIDTCCISELIKKKPNPNVVNWFANQDELSMYLNVITFGELRKGIEKLPASIKKKELSRWVNPKWFNSPSLWVGKDKSPPFPKGITTWEGGSERSEQGDDFLSFGMP